MPSLPVGAWVERAVNFLVENFSGLFDGVAALVQHLVKIGRAHV